MAWVVGERARCVWYGWFAMSSERALFRERGEIFLVWRVVGARVCWSEKATVDHHGAY